MARAPHARTGRTARRTLATLAAGTLAGAGLSFAAAGGAHAADNLAANPGFENGLAGWSCSAGSGSTTGSPVHGGTAALKATPAGLDNARCSQTVSVQPNSAYTLSAWVQGGYVYLGASGTGTTDVSTWLPAASTYQQLTTSFTTGPNTTSVTVYTHGWYGQAAYHVDDVSLTGPGGGPGPQIPGAPTGLTAGTPTSSAVPLSWNPVSGATGYNVYRDGSLTASVTGTGTTVTGLAPATTHDFQVTATNTAGESPKSAAVSVTTAPDDGGPGNGDLPKHVLTGYWQNFDNGATVQTIAQVPAEYDIIAVAFADATATPGTVDFTLDPALGYSEARFKADIDAKQAAGKKVVISVGGELGTVSVNSPASAANFANSLHALIQEFGFDGVDIDLENGVNSTYMTQALRSLSAKVGPGLVITMAPQTLDMQSTGTEYFKTALNIKDILTVVNTQYYNSGAMLGCDGKVYSQGSVDFITALACIQLEGGLDADQVGLGLPASPRGAGSGHVSPSIVTNALDCLTKGTGCGTFKPARTYPALRGAMTWSTNWDALNGNAFSNTVGPHLDTLP